MTRFVFMLLKEHPFGREMLRQLLASGFVPLAIVEEDSDVADLERGKFLERLSGHHVAPSIAEQARAAGTPVLAVTKHDDAHCLDQIQEMAPDLLVLGGTRILRGRLLECAPDGVINSHPGLLPECRGSASPAWSVYHDIPIGSSCHFCTAGIDEGDVVARREIRVRRGATYEDLCYETLVLAGTLMSEALRAYSNGRLGSLRRPQGQSPHPTFRNMPDELLEVVRRKLAEQTYAHYAD